MNIEEIEIDNPLYEKALDLRYRFFFEEFKLPKSVTADELEPFSTHIVIMESEQLLAYGRLSPLESTTFRISKIVVPEECRRKGYATFNQGVNCNCITTESNNDPTQFPGCRN